MQIMKLRQECKLLSCSSRNAQAHNVHTYTGAHTGAHMHRHTCTGAHTRAHTHILS